MLIEEIDISQLKQGDNLLQSTLWGLFKQEFGWVPKAFRYNDRNLLILLRSLPGPFCMAYVPHGPETEMDPPFLEMLAKQLAAFLPSNCLMIRFDLPWRGKYGDGKTLPKPFYSSLQNVQIPSTVVLDLTKEDGDLLGEMKSKTRYNVRLGAKKGVHYVSGGAELLKEWYALHEATTQRDRFLLRPYRYFEQLFEMSDKGVSDQKENYRIAVHMAYVDQEPVAGIINSLCGKRATYLYGASGNSHRNLMAPYGLQWQGILQAKSFGCTEYDLFGIPDSDDPDDHMHGLFRFKTGFGGSRYTRPGCWDLPLKKTAYRAFRVVEKMRLKWLDYRRR